MWSCESNETDPRLDCDVVADIFGIQFCLFLCACIKI